MSELRFETYRMPSANLGPENPLPPLDGCLPYRMQDNYDRVRKEREFNVVVLENERLRATFLMELGGRLWSLFHKPSNRELLYVNPVFQPCNLAIRNAWFSGGVEWNIGIQGHTTHTCSPLFVARVEGEKGLPVLRMYEWERLRMVPFQIDAFLPDGSEFLFVRIRIINPHKNDIPMYWWSNIAVPELPKGRVIVPAEQAYKYGYQGTMDLVPVPFYEGIDQSYPCNFNRSADCFYCIEPGRQPWITSLDEEGSGLIQTSTSLLRGRKLFVWGMGAGGRHWQEFLSVPGSQYIEIQAGLARTQSEYLQMPPNTEWSWLEAYGLMQADPKIIHGPDWKKAYESVDRILKEKMPLEILEDTLIKTNNIADNSPIEVVQYGAGWGALELHRRKKMGEEPFCSDALVFSDESLTDDQKPWLTLLNEGTFPTGDPKDVPGAWMVQAEWQRLLERAVISSYSSHWLSWLHLGVMYYFEKDFESAQKAWEKSISLKPSPWAYRNMAILSKRNGKLNDASSLMLIAYQMAPNIPAIAIECCQTLMESRKYDDVLRLIKNMPLRDHGRIKIMEAQSALQIGDIKRVEEILQSKPVVPDIREGEISLSELWFGMHEKRISKEENIPIDENLKKRVRKEFPPPKWLDFRQTDSV